MAQGGLNDEKTGGKKSRLTVPLVDITGVNSAVRIHRFTASSFKPVLSTVTWGKGVQYRRIKI